jgi:hypothetical protein
MALFRRKEKEQPIHPHTGAEHTRVVEPALPHEATPAPLSPEQQAQPVEQQQPTPLEVPRPNEVPKPGVSGQQAQQTTAQAAPTAPAVKSPAREDIEKVLSEGLVKVYQGMTPQEQEAFRIAGDQAAGNIEQLMTGFRASARVVLEIIRGWLKLIPRVNKYFLEQESKIKTDRILILQRKLKKEHRVQHIRME